MEQQIKEAIDAARSGEKETAQRVLVDLLQENEEQEQAWFLLSHLVDESPLQKAYLGKVLALNPDHTQARQRLLYLEQSETAVAPPVASEDMGMEEQAVGDTVPSWMGEDVPATIPPPTAEAREETAVAPEEPVPDWLEKPLAEGWDEEEREEETVKAPPPAPAAATTPAPKVTVKKPQPQPTPAAATPSSHWNILLYILILMAVIVAGLMAYLIIFG